MPRTYRKDLFVTDVADLTAMISHVDNDLAMLDDNTIYRFEVTSLAAHDGAAVVRPANIAEDAPGRWLRTYAPSGGGFVQDPGRLASNTLHLADDVVDGETVTIGDEVYEAQVINTDSTDNTANGDFNSEDSPLVVPGAVQRYANIDFVEGLVIRIEDEMLRVTAINPNGMVTFARAQSFTEVAAHVDAVDIFVGPGPTEEGNILVGLNTELANWHFLTALSLDITEHSANVHAEAPDEFAMMIWPKTDDFTMALACSHTLSASGATWTRDEMFGNEAPRQQAHRVPGSRGQRGGGCVRLHRHRLPQRLHHREGAGDAGPGRQRPSARGRLHRLREHEQQRRDHLAGRRRAAHGGRPAHPDRGRVERAT